MLKRLFVGAILCVALGAAIEANLGNARKVDPETAHRVIDPSGRTLFMLILDSWRYEDAPTMPHLMKVVHEGFSAPVEPCLERITFVCIKEALTGRSAFSLFGVLQNWGAAADPGENLLRDAHRAGRKVAMVSAGDLAPFSGDIDDEDRNHKGYDPGDLAQALQHTTDHDIVVYHYIWHDTDSHHHRVGSPEYLASVATMDHLVGEVADSLPDGVDLLVTGDHGHAEDGRHVQGQDIPTFVVVRSANVLPLKLTNHIPI